MKKLIQQDIIQYIAKGGTLSEFDREQRKEIPQEIINEYVANGGKIYHLTEEQIKAIPKNKMNQNVVHQFWNLRYKQKILIPQEIINEFVAGGGTTYYLTEKQIKAIPQEIINEYVANGGKTYHLTEKQKKAIPLQIKIVTKEMKESVTLYGIDKISKGDLPIEVFANYETRKAILAIIKSKTIQEFNKICKKYGLVEEIPNELKEEFNARVKEIESEVEMAREGAIEYLETGKIYEIKEDKKKPASKNPSAMEEVKGMGW